MIRLYRAPFSTNVERVTLALAHKGLADQVESVWIDYADRSPVEAVSGQGLVPVIDHDGTVVADSLAILRHLEELAPDPPLFPSEPARRAELELFLDWFDRVWKVAPNAIEADPGGPDVPALSAAMDSHLDRFEALLSGRDHLMGGFSAADCAAYPFLKYAAGREPARRRGRSTACATSTRAWRAGRALAAWIERVASR